MNRIRSKQADADLLADVKAWADVEPGAFRQLTEIEEGQPVNLDSRRLRSKRRRRADRILCRNRNY